MSAAAEMRRELEAYLDVLKEGFGPGLVTVAAFGSRARGDARPESDLDLLVVAEGLPTSRIDRQLVLLRIARTVSEDFADTLACVPLTPEEARRIHPFYLGMLSGHELLCDRGGFLAGVLDGLRARRYARGVNRWPRTSTNAASNSRGPL
jgi:hypothetical protein